MSKTKRNGIKSQILSVREAVEYIADQGTVTASGTGGGTVDLCALINALHRRYVETGCLKNLTLRHSIGLGDRNDRGMSPLALEDLVKRVVGRHWGQSPRLAEMASESKIEAHNFPQGIMAQLAKTAAAGQPGILSHTGLGTSINLRVSGSKLNEVSQEDLIRVMNVDGEEWPYYPVALLDVYLMRAATAGTEDYAFMGEEVTYIGVLRLAQATHDSRGTVILQIKWLIRAGTPHSKDVKIPDFLVDAIVVEEKQEQLYSGSDRLFSGDYTANDSAATMLPLDQRKVVTRRALMEVCPGYVENVGVGVADGIGNIAREEGAQDAFTLIVETGPADGATAQGIFFGATVNARAVMDMPTQSGFYDGGGLDVAFLFFAELDENGDVNIHHFNGKIMGTGGFVNIVVGSKKVVLCGTLRAGKLLTEIRDGKIIIQQEGRFEKLVKSASSATFSMKRAGKQKQEVIYIIERAMFKLMNGKVVLTEIALGIDVQKDIIDQVGFVPEIAEGLKEMDACILRGEKMNIYNELINQ